mmetsp:Transcript_24133/g.60045  ORF Transcript_24133/g.60045 Transcript_24133/m.60045 type:complete len:312 (-) Transcript_24133:873-1808(-)
MVLESERFIQPVFRQFNKERAVVLEERKLRVDNESVGKFLEQFLLEAFDKHPYRRPVIGFEEDILALTREDVESFFRKHYVPSTMTYSIVGNVKLNEVKAMAQKYFGDIQGEAPATAFIEPEPRQTAQKSLTLKLSSEPYYFEGYHIPALDDPMTPSLQVLSGVLSGSRTSRLYDNLIVKQRDALSASFSRGFPGDLYPSLGILYAAPFPGKSLDNLAKALSKQMELVKTPGNVTEVEVDRVKLGSKYGILKTFTSNEALAKVFAEYSATTGDPKNVFRALAALDAVIPGDVTRTADAVFRDDNRTVGKIL